MSIDYTLTPQEREQYQEFIKAKEYDLKVLNDHIVWLKKRKWIPRDSRTTRAIGRSFVNNLYNKSKNYFFDRFMSPIFYLAGILDEYLSYRRELKQTYEQKKLLEKL